MAQKTEYSPDMNIIYQPVRSAKWMLRDYALVNENPIALDVGSGPRGHCDWCPGFRYVSVEYGAHPCSARADVHALPFLDESFDAVIAYNVIEHVKEPWIAAQEIVRVLKPGGLAAIFAPFAWRYHPFPIDFWRFSHAGLAYLFQRTAKMEVELSGYDDSIRRTDARGGKCPNNLDVPPVDELGGWRENWNAVYVGRKTCRYG